LYSYGKVTITVCPCWPASTTNQSGQVTLAYDLLTLMSESRVTWATSVPILVFLGLSVLDLGPMYVKDRQTSDVRQHHRLMPPGRGHKAQRAHTVDLRENTTFTYFSCICHLATIRCLFVNQAYCVADSFMRCAQLRFDGCSTGVYQRSSRSHSDVYNPLAAVTLTHSFI